MKKSYISVVLITFFILCLLFSISCNEKKNEVVIYTSVDQNYSESVLKDFENESEIKVRVVYDVEASKTTGLVNRLVAEKDNPKADVFWNGEFSQTIRLKEEGVLSPYKSPGADDIPDMYCDKQSYWHGIAGRARVIIINTELVKEDDYPKSIFDFLSPKWPADKIGIAYPLFGTTYTQACALYAIFGNNSAYKYFENLSKNGVHIAAGNGSVRDMVVSGQLLFGLTDTDDACGAISKGGNVIAISPDQDSLGTLVIPNTVAMIKNGPNAENAKLLIDYLLSKEVENKLVESGWSHIPLRKIKTKAKCFNSANIKSMNVDLEEVYGKMQIAMDELKDVFVN